MGKSKESFLTNWPNVGQFLKKYGTKTLTSKNQHQTMYSFWMEVRFYN